MTKTADYFDEKLKKIPKYPRTLPPYRIHWNWDISFRCNYKCSYCEVIKRDKEFNYKSIDILRWREIWDRIFELYWSSHVRFSGGEPAIYPKFLDLLAMLLEKNTVDITTNLSFDFKEFLNKVPPDKGLSISASFHPEYNRMKPFLKKVKYLYHNGYPATISYVGFPPQLDRIPEFKKTVEAEGIYFKIIPFSGEFRGRSYPQSYSAGERTLLEEFAHDSEDEHLNEMNTRWYEHLVEKEEEPKKKNKMGHSCQMGQMYAKIHPDGTVTRCCAGYHGGDSGVLGNITDTGFRILDKPTPCKVDYQCPCFKAMVVGEEEDKWVPLWESLEHPVYKTESIKEYVEYIKKGKEKKNVAGKK